MKIWQTFYNADMTEGRGPMVPGPAFMHREHAITYIDQQPGCMGRRALWSKEQYGDWQVKETEVHESCLIQAEKHREQIAAKALAKLSLEERKALGL